MQPGFKNYDASKTVGGVEYNNNKTTQAYEEILSLWKCFNELFRICPVCFIAVLFRCIKNPVVNTTGIIKLEAKFYFTNC